MRTWSFNPHRLFYSCQRKMHFCIWSGVGNTRANPLLKLHHSENNFNIPMLFFECKLFQQEVYFASTVRGEKTGSPIALEKFVLENTSGRILMIFKIRDQTLANSAVTSVVSSTRHLLRPHPSQLSTINSMMCGHIHSRQNDRAASAQKSLQLSPQIQIQFLGWLPERSCGPCSGCGLS